MKSRLALFLGAGAILLCSAAGLAAAGLGSASEPTPTALRSALPTLDGAAGLGAGSFLAGYDEGLFRIEAATGEARALWTGGEVRKILALPDGSGWYLLSSAGVVFSPDLASFEERSTGLPFKTYKLAGASGKSFVREVMDLKDLELDSADPRRLATCTKDAVFVSLDGGRSWSDWGTPVATTGLKAVLLAPLPGSGHPAVWASHPIKGLFARRLVKDSPWLPFNEGLSLLQGTTSVEEIADLALGAPGGAGASAGAPAGAGTAKAAPVAPARGLWASNSFLGRIYRGDPASGKFSQAWSDGSDFGTVESLAPLADGSLRFVTEGAVMRLPSAADSSTSSTSPAARAARDEGAEALASLAARAGTSVARTIAAGRGAGGPVAGAAAASAAPAQLLSLAWAEGGSAHSLNELWLYAFVDRKPFRAAAERKHGIYLQTGYVVNAAPRAKYFKLLEDRGMDSVVVDLKDDYGKLRYAPRDPMVAKLGRVVNPLDVEGLVAEAKAKGVYLIARIPVFKDESLWRAAGGKYAAWDSRLGKPWQGTRLEKVEAAPAAPAAAEKASGAPNPYGPGPAPSGSPNAAAAAPAQPAPAAPAAPAYRSVNIEEYWVDPYSEEVWAYNVAIANEIVARGFDEVQFDYIRFPTDGENIGDVGFRWKDAGMDKESALASFLRHARAHIAAPISIDIYGANGWYRSGVRTGQHVELMAKYVDVICPMFYPSHFEQGFLAQAPAEERPFRIYKLGTLRNEAIARKRVAVRPYVQAFYLNVSYDRAYYNPDYVRREVEGVREASNLGLTYWNNVGRYDDIPRLVLDGRKALAGRGGPRESAPGKDGIWVVGAAAAGSPALAGPVPAKASGAPAVSATEATPAGLLD